MPIKKDTPVVIPAKAEKTLPHTWISQMTIEAIFDAIPAIEAYHDAKQEESE